MEIYEIKMEQKLKKFAHNSGLCNLCLSLTDKPCIFQHNNDEHICPIVENMFEFRGGLNNV